MAKTTVTADKKASSSKPKSKKKAKHADTIATPAIEGAVRMNDDLIRERAYGIWIALGRPHGREHGASLELQGEAA